MSARTRVLVVTLDTIADRMAGPAIRAWEICTALSAVCDVTLVTFGACTRASTAFEARAIRVEDLRAHVAAVDVVVLQGFVMAAFPWLDACEQAIVVDLYDPFHLETLEVDRYRPDEERWAAWRRAGVELEHQMRRGDLFLCASARQRDLWIGHLAAAGRINPATYDDDPELGRLVQVVPFGMPDEAPRRLRPAIKGVVPGIGPEDRVVLWGGGVYNWFDPLTLVRAVAQVRERDPRVHLYFLGMRHPNPDVPEMRVAARTRALADELGLTGRGVHFNEEWVAYEERSSYLLDADVGVSCHYPHVETEFSFRTRILDYLWAGLPVVCTRGDAFADLVAGAGAGVAVPPEDVEALATAIEAALEPVGGARMRAGSADLAARFRWSGALAPLVEYCRAPYRAADAGLVPPASPAAGDGSLAARGVRVLRERGVVGLLAAVLRRAGRLVRGR